MAPVLTLMNEQQEWAENEVSGVEFGDVRLNRRVSAMLARMYERPGGKVTAVFKTSAEREAAFRLLRNEEVDAAGLSHASVEATYSRLGPSENYVVAVDQTDLAVTDRARKKGMGRIGYHRDEKVSGFQVMSGLAIDSRGVVRGVVAQEWRARELDCPSWSEDERKIEQRESILWHRVLEQAEDSAEQAGATGQAWYQMDRGADSWHLWEKVMAERLLVTVRSAYDRRLCEEGVLLHGAVSASKVLGRAELKLERSNAKRSGYRPHRTRQLAVRAKQVELKLRRTKPYKGLFSLRCWIVHVREVRPPARAERIEWFLLTTRPVENFSDALEVARNYQLRWRIEEFHRTWKSSACDVESSQLRSGMTFRKWATLQAAVASRIEQMKRVSRTTPNASALEIASRKEIDTLIMLAHHEKLLPAKYLIWQPGDEMSSKDFVYLLACFGGYTGKSSGGPPGTITIRRGLEYLTPAVAALEAASAFENL